MMKKPSIGAELLDVPIGEMVRDLAFAIAEAQMRLDENSIEVAEMMGGMVIETDADGKVVTYKDTRVVFGKEKMTVGTAVNIYNSTTDEGLKASIKDEAKNHIDIVSGKDEIEVKGNSENVEIFVPTKMSMMELGFAPTFYQFVDTIIEVKISIRYTQEGSTSVSRTINSKSGNTTFGFRRGFRAKRNVTTSQVNINQSQKYSYSAEGSSLLRTKLVPIPPPAILEERIRQQMEIARAKNANASPAPASQTS